jgi:hypothetical protein
MPSSIPSKKEIQDMTTQDYKVLENKLRRAAERQGFRLEKSRVRDPRAISHGSYQLVDNRTNTVAGAGLQSGYGFDLSDVAKFLFEEVDVHLDVDNTLTFAKTNAQPIVRYRETSTNALGEELGLQMPDGWVLYYIRNDGLIGEQLLYVRDFDAHEEALADAKEYMRRMQ